MIALADYGASNTRSVLRALLAAGAEAPTLTDDAATLRRAERVVLPGVGNFAAAKRRLDETGLGDAITDVAKSGRPVLGICLGLQLFLSDSEEAPGVPGLGLLPGRVARFRTELPVPHVGWARVRLTAARRGGPGCPGSGSGGWAGRGGGRGRRGGRSGGGARAPPVALPDRGRRYTAPSRPTSPRARRRDGSCVKKPGASPSGCTMRAA